ncbi:hypothetical protein HF072_15015 [Bacillus sp. RO3]|nr:hypothetical protein [Bacillus sp. RO3]
MSDLNPSLVRRFIQQQTLQEHNKPRTVCRRISSLKSFCQFCLKEHMMSSDLMAGIQSPKMDNKLPVYVNFELHRLTQNIPI